MSENGGSRKDSPLLGFVQKPRVQFGKLVIDGHRVLVASVTKA